MAEFVREGTVKVDPESGSPEWLPVWHGGQTVRFAASAGDLRLPGGTLAPASAPHNLGTIGL